MIRHLFLLFMLLQTSALMGYSFQLSIAAIFQNEAPYLKEWIDYHLKIGVQHFWLYNDESEDQWADVLKPYIADGVVEVTDWSNCRKRLNNQWPQIQVDAYRDAAKKAFGKTKWLAFIDTDEYILPMRTKTIQETIKKYFPQAKAIYMQWLVFGTSGIWLSENESMLSRFSYCLDKYHSWNSIGKSIVRPEYIQIEKIWHPHHFPVFGSKGYFNGSGKKLQMINSDLHLTSHQAKYIRLNHYFFRDEKFYRDIKIPRKIRRGMSVNDLSDLYRECFQRQDFAMIHFLNHL